MTRALLGDLARRTAVVAAGVAVVAVAAVPDPSRPVLVLAGITVAASVAAAALPMRLLGTLVVLSATLTALLAGALDASSVRPLQMVAVAALLLVLVSALSAREDVGAVSAKVVTVVRAPWHRLAGSALVALVAGALVAVTAAQDVVPSVPLVLAGLAAAVAALVIATGGHRT
jgi:hypothetical protein